MSRTIVSVIITAIVVGVPCYQLGFDRGFSHWLKGVKNEKEYRVLGSFYGMAGMKCDYYPEDRSSTLLYCVPAEVSPLSSYKPAFIIGPADTLISDVRLGVEASMSRYQNSIPQSREPEPQMTE